MAKQASPVRRRPRLCANLTFIGTILKIADVGTRGLEGLLQNAGEFRRSRARARSAFSRFAVAR
jgi:hypothetical protein